MGLVHVRVRADRPVDEVIDRAREVLGGIVGLPLEDYPDAAAERLPAWFVEEFRPEPSAEDRERWLAWWRTLDREHKVVAERERGWTMAQWLGWMEPPERTWWWWDATVESDDSAVIAVQVDGWPLASGALEWLLRASGATEVIEIEGR